MKDLLQDEFFIKSVCNPDQEATDYWRRWLERNPDRKDDFELARQAILSIEYKNYKKIPKSASEQMFENIRAFKRLIDEKESLDESNNFLRPYTSRILRVASVVVVLITISFSLYYFDFGINKDQAHASNFKVEKNTPHGVKKTIILPDGTVVKLNSGSELKYPSQFINGKRMVELRGEAFFDVVEDKSRPFIVKTRDIYAQVLGTSFNIRSYQDEENSEVALISGRVKVNDFLGNEILLEPSEKVVFSYKNEELYKSKFNVHMVTGWLENILIFEKSSIEQIAVKLERWYGVKIDFDLSSPIKGSYSGEFKDEPLNVVLDGIGYASEFEYLINGNHVTIKN
ncbi:MAG: anti-sigma factor [Cyclobacteriaceae bacterium]|nr:MAG: anti-sigma factor [Cyclobacteriaceae bacterium]